MQQSSKAIFRKVKGALFTGEKAKWDYFFHIFKFDVDNSLRLKMPSFRYIRSAEKENPWQKKIYLIILKTPLKA